MTPKRLLLCGFGALVLLALGFVLLVSRSTRNRHGNGSASAVEVAAQAAGPEATSVRAVEFVVPDFRGADVTTVLEAFKKEIKDKLKPLPWGERRLELSLLFAVFDQLKAAGASEAAFKDFFIFFKRQGESAQMTVEERVKFLSYLEAGEWRNTRLKGIFSSDPQQVQPGSLPILKQELVKVSNDELRCFLLSEMIAGHMLKPDAGTIDEVIGLVRGNATTEIQGRLLKERYSDRLAIEIMKSDSAYKELKFADLVSRFELAGLSYDFRCTVLGPLASAYGAKLVEAGDFTGLDAALENPAEPGIRDLLIRGSCQRLDGISTEVGIQLLSRAGTWNCRVAVIDDIGNAIQKKEGMQAAAEFARMHFSEEERNWYWSRHPEQKPEQ